MLDCICLRLDKLPQRDGRTDVETDRWTELEEKNTQASLYVKRYLQHLYSQISSTN